MAYINVQSHIIKRVDEINSSDPVSIRLELPQNLEHNDSTIFKHGIIKYRNKYYEIFGYNNPFFTEEDKIIPEIKLDKFVELSCTNKERNKLQRWHIRWRMDFFLQIWPDKEKRRI